MGLKTWFARWQEYAVWLPLGAVIALLAWIVLGSVQDRNDYVRWLLELPVLLTYALAAQAIAQLARRRQRRRLTSEEQDLLWRRALDGDRGAWLLYSLDWLTWLVAFTLSLLFFWPAR